MKRFFSIFLCCVLLLGMAAFPASAAEDPIQKYTRFSLRSLDITITNSATFRIGEANPGELLSGWTVTHTANEGSTSLTYCPSLEGNNVPIYGSTFNLAGKNNNGCLNTENTLSGTLRFACYLADGVYLSYDPNKPTAVSVTVNGVALTLGEPGTDNALSLENTLEVSQTPEGMEIYKYILSIPFSIPWNLPSNPVYRFHLVENPELTDSSNLDFMPLYAEAGAKVRLRPNLFAKGLNASVTGVTANGKEYAIDDYITMPAEDVYLDAILNGGLSSANQTVVKDLSIKINFNEDIYYGRVLPTTEDLKNALSFSTSVKGAGLYLDQVDVDYLFDDSLSESMDPWVGNTWLTFTIRCKSGYIFSDPSISDPDAFVKWMDDNVSITINGKRSYFGSTEGDVYYDGYFFDRYYLADTNGIELHLRWYGGKLLNIDTSACKAGDSVTIPANSFQYKGYIPYRYEYTYTDANGTPHRERVTGSTFTYPQTNGSPIQIYALYVRGEDGTAVQSITKDASEKISLNTDSADFPSGTIVSANLVQSSEKGGSATISHVKTALKDHATDCLVFDISASSFNESVQPDGTVLILFDIPSGYNSDYIDFCYVSEDGTMERIPMQVDKETGKCAAVLEHFSLYAIAKTVNMTEHDAHIVHITTKVDAVAPTCTEGGSIAYYTCDCGKWFSDSAGTKEITDKESVKRPAAHTDADGDTVCDLCGTGGVEPTPTEPSASDGTAPTTTPLEQNSGSQKQPGNDSPLIWIIIGAAALLCTGIVIAVILMKRKNKK